MTIVCGDSHTSTHGAFGALAFGIGTSEVAHVLATQCLLQNQPKTLAITVEGQLRPGVTAKDIILAVIARIGIGGGTGHVIEYRGSAIRALSMEERMTVCNMSIEAGARAGMIAPDDDHLRSTSRAARARRRARPGTRPSPPGAQLPSDPGATLDREENFDAAKLEPMITYGTNPGMGIPIGAHGARAPPTPATQKALRTWASRRTSRCSATAIDVVFIGSCTNSRISRPARRPPPSSRAARSPPGVRALVVPGLAARSRRQAEAEGLDRGLPRRGRRVARGRAARCASP